MREDLGMNEYTQHNKALSLMQTDFWSGNEQSSAQKVARASCITASSVNTRIVSESIEKEWNADYELTQK